MSNYARCLGILAFTLALPALAAAQDRTMLGAGIVGGNSVACPGHYVSLDHRVAGPVYGYGLIESFQCAEVPEPSTRFGAAIELARPHWTVRPALRGGLEYDTAGKLTPTVGASLTFGRRYGARFFVDRWSMPGGSLVLVQIGGFVAF